MRKLLAVFAHPDDEAFGPGGTLAKYASSGVEIHLLCATRGERGQQQISNFKFHTEKFAPKFFSANKKKELYISNIREKELLRSAEVLGIKEVEFLDFVDGQLGNANYHDLAKKITAKIKSFKPQIILTLDRLGVSGHLDHIAVSMVTTYSFNKTREAQKLYYYCLPKKWYTQSLSKYFIYFPEGYKESELTTRIDFSDFWQIKRKAMFEHKSQLHDVKRLLRRFDKRPKTDHFILQYHRLEKIRFPEDDLFAGIR